MRVSLAARTAWAGLLPGLVSCFATTEVPANAEVACAQNADCPSGFSCLPNLGRCIKEGSGDVDPPEIVAGTGAIVPSPAGVGATVLLRFGVNETLGTSPELLLVDLNGVAESRTLPVGVIQEAGLSFIYAYIPSANEPETRWSVRARLIDSVGNVNPGAELGTLTLDFTAPSLAQPPVVSRGAVALGGEVVITIAVTEVLGAEPRAFLTWSDTAMTRLLETGNHRPEELAYEFRYTARGDEPTEQVLIRLELMDPAGNNATEIQTLPLRFDFDAPAVASVEPVSVLAPPETLLASAQHLTYKSTYAVRFSPNEKLAEAAIVRMRHPALPPENCQEGVLENEFLCKLDPSRSYPQGRYDVEVTLTDEAGNVASHVLNVDRPLVVDTVPPASPRVDVPGALSFTRAPWGTAATGGQPQFSLVGASNGLEGCDPALPLPAGQPCHWVVALTQQDAGPDVELGRTSVDTSGGFSSFALAGADVPVLWVVAVDAAGNVSDHDQDPTNGVQAVAVQDTTWIATLTGKTSNSNVANPHRLIATPDFRVSLGQDENRAVEPALDPPLGLRLQAPDGATVSAASERIWTQRFSTSLKPVQRTEHATAYDSERGRVVMFGGRDAVGELQDVWEWDGVRWDQIFVEGDVPSPRAGHAMAFDAARGQTVMFGGLTIDGSLSDETWLWNGAAWVRANIATTPAARRYQRMAYFPERGTVIMFGGLSATELNDVWEWNGFAWVEVVAGGARPPARWDHAMAYNPNAGELYVYGGRALTPKADFWKWDGLTWEEIHFLGDRPSAAFINRMVFDFVRDRLVLFGEKTWEWDGVRWMDRAPLSEPEARGMGELEYDPVRQRVVLVGGEASDGDCNGGGQEFCQDVWEWGGSVWAEVTPGDALVPDPRDKHTIAYDSVRLEAVVFGGSDGPFHSGTWAWTGANWVNRTPGLEPAVRIRSALVFDPDRDRAVLFGGLNLNSACSPSAFTSCGDTWSWSGANWIPIIASASPPARHSHAMVYVRSNTRVACPHGPYLPSLVTQQAEPYALADGQSLSVRVDFVSNAGAPTQTVTFNAGDFANIASATAAEVAAVLSAGVSGAGGTVVGIGGGNGVTLASDVGVAGSIEIIGGDANGVLRYPTCLENPGAGTLVFGGSRGRGSATEHCANEGDCRDTWLLVEDWPATGDQSWIDFTNSGSNRPSPRSRHAMAFDAVRGVVVLFGGLDATSQCSGEAASSGRACADTWEWGAFASCTIAGDFCWREATSAGDAPRGRSSHVMAYDETRQRTVLHGGQLADGTEVTDLWEWDGLAWNAVTPPSINPSPRFAHVMTYDSVRQKVVVFGGSGRRDTWELDADPQQRPSLVATFDWRFAAATVADVLRVEADVYASGVGYVTAGVETPVDGSALLVWQPDNNGWVRVASNNAGLGGSPSLISFSSADASEAQALFADEEFIHIAVQPQFPMGNGSSPAQVELDYVELRVSYRRVP